MELKDFEKWMNAEECFSMAVEGVQMRCKDMHEGLQLRYVFMIPVSVCICSLSFVLSILCF